MKSKGKHLNLTETFRDRKKQTNKQWKREKERERMKERKKKRKKNSWPVIFIGLDGDWDLGTATSVLTTIAPIPYHIKARCHIPLMHAFSTLYCVFLVLTLIGPTNVITRKTQCNAVNSCVDGMWQLGLNRVLLVCLQSRVATSHLRAHIFYRT